MATSPYWTAIQLLNQIAGELGIPQYTTVIGGSEQNTQLLALTNAAGNELLMYYTWQQFMEEWTFTTSPLVGEYAIPDDWAYFTDQTQWDRTNHWPLLGPKSPQEWAWLKGGLVASAPRTRYRVQDGMFKIWPVPAAGASPLTLSMEYIVKNWIKKSDDSLTDMITADGDLIRYNPWLINKYVKLKFYELKGFDTAGVQSYFMRMFNALTGKDVGAPILSLTRAVTNQYIGPWSIPDGSWNVNGGP